MPWYYPQANAQLMYQANFDVAVSGTNNTQMTTIPTMVSSAMDYTMIGILTTTVGKFIDPNGMINSTNGVNPVTDPHFIISPGDYTNVEFNLLLNLAARGTLPSIRRLMVGIYLDQTNASAWYNCTNYNVRIENVPYPYTINIPFSLPDNFPWADLPAGEELRVSIGLNTLFGDTAINNITAAIRVSAFASKLPL